MQTLTNKGLKITLENGRLAVAPKTALTDDLREFIRVNKKQLLSELQTLKTENVRTLEIKRDEFPGVSTKNLSELAEIKTDKFHAHLNQFIEVGISFEVSADDFQVVDSGQILKASDREFLELNESAILCELQQSLLMKHLFSHSPFLLNDFAFEIRERESILTEVAETTYERYCTAVKDVTRNWFEHFMNKQTF